MKNKPKYRVEVKNDYSFSGDDLGTQYFTYKNSSIAKAVNSCLTNKGAEYNIVHIKVTKKWWLYGPLTVEIVCEDSAKIKALEGTQHYSKSYADD